MRVRHVLLAIALAASAAAGACGTQESTFPVDAGFDASIDGAPVVMGDATPPPFQEEDAAFADFPATPIIESGDAGITLPPNIGDLFANAPAGASGGPCLVEPEIGSMYPRNWLRPRFRWTADLALADFYPADAAPDAADASPRTSPQNVFEIKLTVPNQPNALVVYTTNASWTMPKAMWDGLRVHSTNVPMTLTVRGGVWDGAALAQVTAGSTGTISIAPVDAPGTIVYWTSTGSGSGSGYDAVLKGFRVGDETVAEVIRPAQLAKPASVPDAGSYQCLGCHSSTPDGLFAAVSARPEPSGGGTATRIALGGVDGDAGLPSFLTPSARTLLDRSEQEMPIFTPGHWAPGDRIAVSMLMTSKGTGHEIVWTDLEAQNTNQGTAWGVFARTGDTGKAALAMPSHDGNSIVYVSTPDTDTAGTIVDKGSLYTIPWNNRQGGTATELAGANEPGMKQFYPAYSPDDKLVIFDRSPVRKDASSYNDPYAELYVVPASGGQATRLKANDPPACSGARSPGIHNAWPKWSPKVRSDGGKDYYFLVFSSSRANGPARFGARLYVTPIVVSGGTIETFGALYLWNQPENEDNHSPAWDELQIPPVGPPK